MTSVSEAVDVMNVVTACHHRTAPRMDDEQATIATATLWADLFSEYDLTVKELIEAVKQRAKACPDAPEPADIIRVARSKRSDLMARTETGYDLPGDDEHYPGDAKAAPDPADYPENWTSTERLSAYQYALVLRVVPHTTASWEALAAQMTRKQAERGAS